MNESGLSPPPEKRPRSYSPPLGNHVEPKTDLQESLLGQALAEGPTIHTTPTNNVQVRKSRNTFYSRVKRDDFYRLQAQSTGEDSNSMSDNEEEMSNNDSILNSVKTEPSDILNDSMEHHRNSFPALLGIPGNFIGIAPRFLCFFFFFFFPLINSLWYRNSYLIDSIEINIERDRYIALYFLFRVDDRHK